MADRKVAVVGMAGIFPTCNSLDEFGDKLFSNKSLVREWPLANQYNRQMRSKVSAYSTLEEVGLKAQYSSIHPTYPEIYLDTKERIPIENLATADIGSIWAMLSCQEAIAMAGWSELEVQSEQTGVVIGSGAGGHEVLRHSWDAFFREGKKSRHIGSHGVDRGMVYRDAANVATLLRTKGVCESIGSACACGLGNIGYAYRLIKMGLQDRILAGGVEGTSIETFVGFDAMAILSRGYEPEKSSRPFDKRRNGFVCSFGAGIVGLEELEQAKARGANIIAVIDGYFNNSDGDGDLFAPCFDGQKRLWKGLKTQVPNLNPEVVKVHGTSTPVGDGIELFSVTSELGERGYHISAPKSQFGHMLGAAGSVEFIAALMMIEKQTISPCLNAQDLNEELEVIQSKTHWKGPRKPIASYRELLPTAAIKKEINQVVSLNYGFGGTNAIISISKYHG